MTYKHVGDTAEHNTARGLVRAVVVRQGDLPVGAIILNTVAAKRGRPDHELLVVTTRDPAHPDWLQILHLDWSTADARWTQSPASPVDDGSGFFNYADGDDHLWQLVVEADDQNLQQLLDQADAPA